MKKSIVVILGLLIGGYTTSAAEARSKAAQYIIAEQIAAVCEGPGAVDADAVIERDLTGDGKDDLIIYSRGISCVSNENQSCGTQLCGLVVYVRQGPLLKLKLDIMSAEFEIVEGDPPGLRLFAHGGRPIVVRWDGRSFK
jgi:hypothetical protein